MCGEIGGWVWGGLKGMFGVAGCFEWYVSDFDVWTIGKSGGVVWMVVRLWMCRL